MRIWNQHLQDIMNANLQSKRTPLKIFGLNLGKLPNYMRYFGSNNVEGVAESWVETEMSWVEVDGGRRRWVEVGARFSNTHFNILKMVCQNGESNINWVLEPRTHYISSAVFCFAKIFRMNYMMTLSIVWNGLSGVLRVVWNYIMKHLVWNELSDSIKYCLK